jgi:formiminoglutamase
MPYHRKIQKYVSGLDLQVCLDCHSMASIPPKIAPDAQQKKRPLFCLSNQNGKTSPQELMGFLGECISESFFIEKSDVFFNDPFKGGHITKTYGNNPIPWIQIEMNRDMYLSEEWFDKETLNIDNKRLTELNSMFEKTLDSFAKIWI